MSSVNGLRVELLKPDDNERLRDFLQASPQRSVFHTPEWQQFVEASYGHKCHYWAAKADETILGVFPVTVVRHPLLGTKMVALAYQMHTGLPIALDRDIQRMLVERALTSAERERARYLEVRTRAESDVLTDLGFDSPEQDLVVTTTPLEDIQLSQIRRGHRGEVRYALRRGVSVAESQSVDDLRQFHSLYQQEGRALGVPRPGWSFYRLLKENLGDQCRLIVASNEAGEMLGSLVLLEDGVHVFARDGAYSSAPALRLKIGKALFWQAMQEAAARGNRYFHFGISWVQNEGLIQWKEGWNGTSSPVFQYIYTFGSRTPSPGSYFSGFRLAKAVWRRLPVTVADRLGQQITRWIC